MLDFCVSVIYYYLNNTKQCVATHYMEVRQLFDPTFEGNRETYLAWKHYWLHNGKTLDDAIEYGRQIGGDAYAERLRKVISEMEAPGQRPV